MTTFAEKVEAVHRALNASGVAYGFGGALALAFCVGEPRATADIDVNIFVPPLDAEPVFASLPTEVRVTDSDRARAVRDGQIRLWWDDTALDLFFGYHEFHDQVARRIRTVPFGDEQLPVIDCTDLAVFKAVFGRLRDWADIEAMTLAGTVNAQEALEWIGSLMGASSDAYHRLAEAFAAREPEDATEAYRRAFGRPPSDGS